jgi:hypothetical protein
MQPSLYYATLRTKAGGAEGIRTPDLLIANETLYQLSYDPNHFNHRTLGLENESAIFLFPRRFSRSMAAKYEESTPAASGFY